MAFTSLGNIKGQKGDSITSVTKTATNGLVDTYTITFDNGSSTTFDVTNGLDGKDGEVSLAYLEERLGSFSSDMDCGGASSVEDSFLDLGSASSIV